MRYKKEDLERIIMAQLENLNAQGEHIELIKKQNELSDKTEPKPYPIPKRKKS